MIINYIYFLSKLSIIIIKAIYMPNKEISKGICLFYAKFGDKKGFYQALFM